MHVMLIRRVKMGLLLTCSEDMASDIERKRQEEHFMKKA